MEKKNIACIILHLTTSPPTTRSKWEITESLGGGDHGGRGNPLQAVLGLVAIFLHLASRNKLSKKSFWVHFCFHNFLTKSETTKLFRIINLCYLPNPYNFTSTKRTGEIADEFLVKWLKHSFFNLYSKNILKVWALKY